ncbi:universal stress protein [Desertimonas flava]|jgi:hypothetical protein|uniref:universal stress protein n=1 Tax=Desertimonas flava TaxID=2064846 RepID=UPI000E342319|nr:universal stress protein [Desertimonas flava]
MPTILIVANQTLGGEALTECIEKRRRLGPCSFYVVVPATPPKEHLTWTEGEARAIAAQRLEGCLDQLRATGADVEGEVGDANPMLAVADAMNHHEFDAVIVATLPAGLSRWLKLSLPDRIARRYGLPVDHVVVAPSHV